MEAQCIIHSELLAAWACTSRQNWQLKKNGRIGYVSERAFENAQIIMESERSAHQARV
jgi:hypothetical protein